MTSRHRRVLQAADEGAASCGSRARAQAGSWLCAVRCAVAGSSGFAGRRGRS
eukprot:CAMPEP_0170406930 /NCGR_PEP_ID=MMETSP0117_2-20130122/27982_1 /TAXON_ID=400756 /ORGANISM="Durinskia baltica, Strain CSIRO CS-38" /LENGTH=51 /DNA_ID=CAMNT_0010664155 /DNA_START=21 /DNA_END=176 /DNA_ORIENTATION=-